ncbi:MAG: nucleotidyltransferase domain-containing protein [Candidatus Bathyarchaeota archaeon]|nr:nucleotidyltransferase domain-containing protein [Candidatus Bathyarchaeota archaeon]
MQFRDRDAPTTPKGLIFRTYGYDHPTDACFCDLEYAPETAYRTDDPRAIRNGRPTRYYKFYFDGGLRFVRERHPQYQLLHRPLDQVLVGVERGQLDHVVRPDDQLQELMRADGDPLMEALKEVLNRVMDASTLRPRDFGVFGSLAHRFHNPLYSDIDLIIYGKRELMELRTALAELYAEGALRNEFEDWTADQPPAHWNFTSYSKEEYGWYQRRKLIYAVYKSEELGRTVKVEFEPVRRWEEVENEYEATRRIENLGRVEAVVEVLSDEEAGFMPSIYHVELREIDRGIDARGLRRVDSYVEEFRLQVEAGEKALVRGNLELVDTSDGQFYQIVLSYGPDYFDQVLKLR